MIIASLAMTEDWRAGTEDRRFFCGLCRGTYRDPKLLPCLHVFCRSCLESRIVVKVEQSEPAAAKPSQEVPQTEDNFVVCPLCGNHCNVSHKGVGQLPSCYRTISLVEQHVLNERLRRATGIVTADGSDDGSTSSAATCDHCQQSEEGVVEYCFTCKEFQCNFCTLMHTRYSGYANHKHCLLSELSEHLGEITHQQEENTCMIHKDEKMKLYCQDCKRLICTDCTIRDHKDHDFAFITSEVTADDFKAIHSLRSTVSELQEAVSHAHSNAELEKENTLKQQSDTKLDIQLSYERLQQQLQSRRLNLEQQADDLLRQPLSELESTLKSVKLLSESLQRCTDYLSDISHNGPLAVLSSVPVIRQYVNTLSQQAADLHTTKRPVLMNFHPSGSSDLVERLSTYGQVHLNVTEAKSEPCPPSSDTTSIPQASPSPNSPCHAVPAGKQNETCAALSRLFTQSQFIPCVLGVPLRAIEGITKPCGLAITGQIYVCELGVHRLSLLDMLGRRVKSLGGEGIGKGCFNSPHGVFAYEDGRVLVTDLNNRVQLFTSNGKCSRVIGSKMSRDKLRFQDPTGIAVGPQGYVYICEGGNHCIQILNEDLSFRASFGGRGNQPGQLNYPSDIATDQYGNLYVADCRNHRIQLFTEEGTFILEFGSQGSAAGCLDSPCSLCIDPDGFVYVSELRNHRVSVFCANGDFVMTFGSKGSGLGQFHMPRGIALDANMLLYVCDFKNHRIQIFK